MYENVYINMKTVKFLFIMTMFIKAIASHTDDDDCISCIDSRENLMSAFDNLKQLQTASSFTQGLYVPNENTEIVDLKMFEDLERSCRLSSQTDDGFYPAMYKLLDRNKRSTTGNIQTTCPWVSVSNYNINRLPVEITEAKCVCNQCLEKVPRGANVFRYVPRLGRCKQVMTSVTVLRRHCNTTSGYFDYVADTEKISVGCTCIRPYIVT